MLCYVAVGWFLKGRIGCSFDTGRIFLIHFRAPLKTPFAAEKSKKTQQVTSVDVRGLCFLKGAIQSKMVAASASWTGAGCSFHSQSLYLNKEIPHGRSQFADAARRHCHNP